MKILITGGCGYVGGYLVDYLSQRGYDITVYDNLTYEMRYLKNVQFVFGDIRDKEKLSKLLPQFDCVIWLAAIVGDGACAIDQFLTQSINEDTVKWLVDNYSGKIIFPSTCSVYGINDNLLDEQSPINTLSVYAKTKLAAEQYIVKNRTNYLIFRLGTLFGLSDDHSRMRLDLVVNVLTKKAVLGEELKVFGGDQWRPLLHVKDVAHAIEYGIRNEITGLYNLSYQNYKICDIATEIQKHIPGTNVKLHDLSFEDLRNYKVKTDKYLAAGWKPQLALEHGVKEIEKVVREARLKDVNDAVYSNVDYLKKIWKGNK